MYSASCGARVCVCSRRCIYNEVWSTDIFELRVEPVPRRLRLRKESACSSWCLLPNEVSICLRVCAYRMLERLLEGVSRERVAGRKHTERNPPWDCGCGG